MDRLQPDIASRQAMASILSSRGLTGDLLGGVTTAVVSLPMALAFGALSGAGAQAGLYGAVLVGFWAALFGGTNTLISGPTGPMTVIMAALLTRLAGSHPEHALALGFTAVVIAGMVQILFGLLRLGRYITLMPYSVISGFMSGIGVLLIIMQLPGLLGQPAPRGGTVDVLTNLPALIAGIRWPEFLLAMVSLAILFLEPASWRRRIPPALLVLVFGLLCGWVFYPGDHLRYIGAIPMGLPSLRFPVFTPNMVSLVLVDGLILGALGCVDTLLTAVIADSLTNSEHRSDRELIGQGIGNMVSGLFGGLPGAGATMGTLVNIQCGAQTRRSGIIRSLVLLGVILAAAPLLRSVPMVVLSAILFKVGVDVLDWSFLRRAHKVSLTAALIMYGVLILAVLVDVIVAVGIGVFIANLINIERLSRLQSAKVKTIDPASTESLPMTPDEKRLFEKGAGRIIVFHLSGPMIFGVANAIARERAAMRRAEVLIVELSDVCMLGTTAGLAIENVIRDARAVGCAVIVSGAGPKVRERLERLALVGDDAATFSAPNRLSALEQALTLIADDERAETHAVDKVARGAPIRSPAHNPQGRVWYCTSAEPRRRDAEPHVQRAPH